MTIDFLYYRVRKKKKEKNFKSFISLELDSLCHCFQDNDVPQNFIIKDVPIYSNNVDVFENEYKWWLYICVYRAKCLDVKVEWNLTVPNSFQVKKCSLIYLYSIPIDYIGEII